MHTIIRFPDKETEQKALRRLIPGCSQKSWANGETRGPDAALRFLAAEGFPFSVVRAEPEWPSETR